MDNNSNFTVIRGGLSDSSLTSSKEFVHAYITDSRLMGVVGVYVHWYLPENILMKHFHQFFYFDAEEFGFDTYDSVLAEGEDDMLEDIKAIEADMFGNLGAKKVSISEKEVRYMVQSFTALNIKSELELPKEYEEYKFLLTPQVEMSYEEEYALMCRQCPVITSHYEVINYFLMRCLSRDFGAAKFLTRNYVRTDIFPEHKAATLLRNIIEEATDEESGTNTDYYCTDNDKDFGTFSTRKSYMCQSVIEYDGKYFILVTQITLDKLKVAGYERISSFRISTTEVSMMTVSDEFITVFDYAGSGAELDKSFTRLASTAAEHAHFSGRLLMIFYPHNEHVNRAIYSLADDVMGLYYILDNGQIIACANSRDNIDILEKDIMHSPYSKLITPVSKYHFTEQIFYEFINSELEDFETFVDLISEKDTD